MMAHCFASSTVHVPRFTEKPPSHLPWPFHRTPPPSAMLLSSLRLHPYLTSSNLAKAGTNLPIERLISFRLVPGCCAAL